MAPLLSEYWNVKVCCNPLPDEGVADTTETAGLAPVGTVHIPMVCQPLLIVPLVPYM